MEKLTLRNIPYRHNFSLPLVSRHTKWYCVAHSWRFSFSRPATKIPKQEGDKSPIWLWDVPLVPKSFPPNYFSLHFRSVPKHPCIQRTKASLWACLCLRPGQRSRWGVGETKRHSPQERGFWKQRTWDIHLAVRRHEPTIKEMPYLTSISIYEDVSEHTCC